MNTLGHFNNLTNAAINIATIATAARYLHTKLRGLGQRRRPVDPIDTRASELQEPGSTTEDF
jgi:hypothetical protein